MPFSENAQFIINKFYLKRDKSGKLLEKNENDIFSRVADFVSSAEKDDSGRIKLKSNLIDLMINQKFMFSSPTLFNAARIFLFRQAVLSAILRIQWNLL